MSDIPTDDVLSGMTRDQLRAIAPPCVKGRSAAVLFERISAYRDRTAIVYHDTARATAQQQHHHATEPEDEPKPNTTACVVEPSATDDSTRSCAPNIVNDLLDWYEERKVNRMVHRSAPVPTKKIVQYRMDHRPPPPQSMASVDVRKASQIKAERRAVKSDRKAKAVSFCAQ